MQHLPVHFGACCVLLEAPHVGPAPPQPGRDVAVAGHVHADCLRAGHGGHDHGVRHRHALPCHPRGVREERLEQLQRPHHLLLLRLRGPRLDPREEGLHEVGDGSVESRGVEVQPTVHHGPAPLVPGVEVVAVLVAVLVGEVRADGAALPQDEAVVVQRRDRVLGVYLDEVLGQVLAREQVDEADVQVHAELARGDQRGAAGRGRRHVVQDGSGAVEHFVLDGRCSCTATSATASGAGRGLGFGLRARAAHFACTLSRRSRRDDLLLVGGSRPLPLTQAVVTCSLHRTHRTHRTPDRETSGRPTGRWPHPPGRLQSTG